MSLVEPETVLLTVAVDGSVMVTEPARVITVRLLAVTDVTVPLTAPGPKTPTPPPRPNPPPPVPPVPGPPCVTTPPPWPEQMRWRKPPGPFVVLPHASLPEA